MPAATIDAALLSMPAHLSGLETLERLASLETLSPIFRKACQREVTRAHHARRRHEARSGVCWSGMDDDPYALRPLDALRRDAEAEEALRNAPRGRFCAALNGMEDIDPARGYELRALYARNLADDRAPLDTAAVGAALALLNAIPGKAARDAIDALAELLIETRKAA